MKKLSLILLSLMIAFTVVLAGCGSSNDESTSNESSESSETSSESTESKEEAPEITITWWVNPAVNNVVGFEEETKEFGNFEKLIAAKFMEKYPNVTVEVESLTWEDLPVKVPASIAAGTPPDLYRDYVGRTAGYAWQNALENMEDLFTQDELALYVDSFVDSGKINGILHGIPVSAFAYGFVYNKAITDKIGTTSLFPTPDDPYWTIDEFYAAIKASKQGDYVPFAAQIGKPQGDQPLYILFDAFGGSNFKNGDYSKTALNSPETLKAVEFFKKLNEEKLLQPDVASAGYDETTLISNNGLLVSEFYTPAKQILAEAALKEGNAKGEHNWILVAPPGEGNTFVGPEYLVVFKQKDEYKKKMIAELIKYITSDEWLLPYVLTGGVFGGTKTILDHPDTQKDPANKTMARILAEKKAIDVGLASPKFAEFRPLLQPELQAVMLNQKTPQQALNDFEKNINDVLSK